MLMSAAVIEYRMSEVNTLFFPVASETSLKNLFLLNFLYKEYQNKKKIS